MPPILKYPRIPKLSAMHAIVLVILVSAYAAFDLTRGANLSKAHKDYETAKQQNDPQAVIKAIDEIMRLDGKASAGFVNRAYYHAELDELSKSIEDYDNALQLDPSCVDAFVGRARLHYTLAQYEDAVKDYTEAIRLAPTLQVAYRIRGCSYSQLGLMDKAFNDFNKALELDSKDGLTYFVLGTAHEKVQQFQKAADDYGEAIKNAPRLSKVGYECRANLFKMMDQPALEKQNREKAKASADSAEEESWNFGTDMLDQEVYDDKILTELTSNGCKLDQARRINHMFCVPHSESMTLIATVKQQGLLLDEKENEFGAKGSDWLQIICHEDAQANSMPRRTAQLIRLAYSVGARYCGWSTELDPSVPPMITFENLK
jgi:tetratricopeptide (TPR) repeat protein